MRTVQPVLTDIIGAIGEHDFAANLAGALCRFAEFNLAAVLVHRAQARSEVLFDNFDAIGRRDGLSTYAQKTCRLNPMLRGAQGRVVRARDYSVSLSDVAASLRPFVLSAPEEELGFRTVGWPERHEEVSMYFPAWGGVVECGLYRARARKSASGYLLRALDELTNPIAAAFERHHVLRPALQPRTADAGMSSWRLHLTDREREICELLLAGCSSETIALRLSLSRHTVKDHRKNIFRKLGIGSLAELFARAR